MALLIVFFVLAVLIGYALSSEEHPPSELVRLARAAEHAGFTYALVSDRVHPWTDRQGESSFVWSVVGAIAQATERLRLGAGVTFMRFHERDVLPALAAVRVLGFPGPGTREACPPWSSSPVRQRAWVARRRADSRAKARRSG